MHLGGKLICQSFHDLVLAFATPVWDWGDGWWRNRARNWHLEWMRVDKLSLHLMRKYGAPAVQFFIRPKVTFSQSVSFLSNQSHYRLRRFGVARTLNKDQKLLGSYLHLLIYCIVFKIGCPVQTSGRRLLRGLCKDPFMGSQFPTPPVLDWSSMNKQLTNKLTWQLQLQLP